MLPLLVPMLTNVIGGLVADAATDLAKEHVTDMIEKVIPPEAMQIVDKLVEADPSQPCSGMVDLITRMADPDDIDVPIPPMPSTDQMVGWSESMAPAAGQIVTSAMMSAVAGMNTSTSNELHLTIRHDSETGAWSFEEHAHPHS